MALPTFQGVQAISSVTDLAGIFGDATSFTYMANNRWTHNANAVTGWGNIQQNRNHFISYINLAIFRDIKAPCKASIEEKLTIFILKVIL